MALWFVVREGDEEGPVTAGQLKEMAATGKLQPGDLVRRDDMQTPREASTIKGLFSSEGRSTPSSPPPTPASRSETSAGDGLKGKKIASKKLVVILSGVAGACLLLCCGGFGVIALFGNRMQDAARKELAEGDSLWDKGDKANAVQKYRAVLGSRAHFLKEEDRPRAYGRVIDFDMESGNAESAKQLLAEAARNKVTPQVSHPDAKTLLASAPATGQQTGGTEVSRGDVLTADYLPCIAGNVKQYDEDRFDFDTGRPVNRSTDKITFHGDNKMTLEWSTASPGQAPTTGKGPITLEVKDGVVEWRGRIAIKVGARPGDEWPSPRGQITYKLVRFEKAEAKGGGEKVIELHRAVVESRFASDDGKGGKTEYLTEYVLEKGGGLQTEKEYMSARGRKVLIRDRRLVSSTCQ